MFVVSELVLNVFFQLHNIHIHLPGHNRKSVHGLTIHSIFMKNTIEQQNLQYENVAEFLKNIFLIDACVQHSRTINYSTVRSLP